MVSKEKSMKIIDEKISDILQNCEDLSKFIIDCLLCKKKHAVKFNFPGCQHIFGKKCLESYFIEEFEKNDLFVLSCPVENCNSLLFF